MVEPRQKLPEMPAYLQACKLDLKLYPSWLR